ncbi:MAG TPA: hypothetical protein VFJ19_13395 [Nocardioidaceae bacterium]|nr:hypothetical protein [Nocardioidaceae bacterium]
MLARRRGLRLLLRDVLRHDDRGDAPVGERHLAGAVDELARLGRMHAGLDEVGRDILVEGVGIDLLLERRTEGDPLLLAEDRHHRLVV